MYKKIVPLILISCFSIKASQEEVSLESKLLDAIGNATKLGSSFELSAFELTAENAADSASCSTLRTCNLERVRLALTNAIFTFKHDSRQRKKELSKKCAGFGLLSGGVVTSLVAYLGDASLSAAIEAGTVTGLLTHQVTQFGLKSQLQKNRAVIDCRYWKLYQLITKLEALKSKLYLDDKIDTAVENALIKAANRQWESCLSRPSRRAADLAAESRANDLTTSILQAALLTTDAGAVVAGTLNAGGDASAPALTGTEAVDDPTYQVGSQGPRSPISGADATVEGARPKVSDHAARMPTPPGTHSEGRRTPTSDDDTDPSAADGSGSFSPLALADGVNLGSNGAEADEQRNT